MSTRASTDIAVDGNEGTELTWTVDLNGQDEADLAIYTLGNLTGPQMAVGMYREEVQALIDRLTADLHRVPPRP